MANDNASTFSFTLPGWPSSPNGVPKIPYAALSKEALGFAASRLQDQAEYLKKLAECEDFTEAVKYQMDFAQQSWSRCFGEAWSMFDHMRTQSQSGS
jgi:Phasin protein